VTDIHWRVVLSTVLEFLLMAKAIYLKTWRSDLALKVKWRSFAQENLVFNYLFRSNFSTLFASDTAYATNRHWYVFV
jgi:hypothetical protein